MSYAAIDRERVRAACRTAATTIWRVTKSTLQLLGGLAVTASGAGMIGLFALELRLPDSVLLQQHAGYNLVAPSSVTPERDLCLLALGVGVFVLLLGLSGLADWWKSLRADGDAQ
jgi:hypothetical protein